MSGIDEDILLDLGRKNLQNNKIDDAMTDFKRLINSQNIEISSKLLIPFITKKSKI